MVCVGVGVRVYLPYPGYSFHIDSMHDSNIQQKGHERDMEISSTRNGFLLSKLCSASWSRHKSIDTSYIHVYVCMYVLRIVMYACMYV